MNIDAEIAEKLFGITRGPCANYSDYGIYVIDILEALRKKGFITEITYGRPRYLAHVQVFDREVDRHGQAWEESLPLALCKAALLALEGK